MSNPPGLRDRKKAETRLAISNVATRLFVERGFEGVSVDEIALAAGVARKTVFNYFPRKEDLVFDRGDDARTLVRDALAARGRRPPLRALRTLVRSLLEQRHPLFRMSRRPVRFWRTVAQSPALTTHARQLQATLADDLAAMLAESADRRRDDADARLAASMLMSTLVVAYGEALRAFREKREPARAFARVTERGFAGVEAALAGTPYVRVDGRG
ncbi:MAG: TetR/AcrR family transcriptional regulator [Dokdonella sp.]|uniref:TetR/AcrR family transcriptional regulator n=1 Tax=Dokdonella sp. TaxID=2291710 RepID=UPI003F811EE1